MRTTSRCHFSILLLLFVSAIGWGADSGLAADYPSRPVRLIVAFLPSGAADPVARAIASALGAHLGQPIVILNRGGAGGSVGMDEAAKSAADGYTLLLSQSVMAHMPALHRELPFDPVKDFDEIIDAVSSFYVLAVNTSIPAQSVTELIDYARANPGKLTYGSAGIGSVVHLAGEMLKRAADIDILHIPYKGAGPAVTDLMGGQIAMMFGPASSILPLAEAGKIRALAVTSPKRSALVPDLPTMEESLSGFEIVGWYGLAAPAGTPKGVIAKLNADANQALQTPELIAALHQLGYEPMGGTPEQADTRIKSDVLHWSKIIHDAGIQAE